jgi:hypothetical protein
VIWLALLGCGLLRPEPPQGPELEVLVLTVEGTEQHSWFQAQLVVPKGASERDLPPATLFPPLAGALRRAIPACLDGRPLPETEGWELRTELHLDGRGGAVVRSPAGETDGVARCIAGRMQDPPLSGLPPLRSAVPFRVAALSEEDLEAQPVDLRAALREASRASNAPQGAPEGVLQAPASTPQGHTWGASEEDPQAPGAR